jgi:hypothetical protein
VAEAAARLDRGADDDELCAALGGDASDVLAEAPGTRAHDLPPHAHAVRAHQSGRRLEPLLQARERAVHVRVQRQLALDDERRDENDLGAPVGRETAGEVERMLRLLLVEQRHDNAAIGDRAGPAREASCPSVEHSDGREPHRMSWYGTEARITCGSTSSSRFT